MYPEAAFHVLAERLAIGSPAAKDVRDYSRLFYSQAACVVPDRQWRFRIPLDLSKWAGLGSEVMIVGVRDHLEIWPVDKWEQYLARCDPQFDRLAELALTHPVPGSREWNPATALADGPPSPPVQPR
jgi:MraZ protein